MSSPKRAPAEFIITHADSSQPLDVTYNCPHCCSSTKLVQVYINPAYDMDRYFEALRDNLEHGLRSPQIAELVCSLHAVYKTFTDSPPPGHVVFGRFLLVCHKSMLSAAALIAERQPEDCVGVTRRAVEAAEAALAFKLNDANAAQWPSYQERHERWLKRQAGEKPRPFHVQYTDVVGEPLMDEIKRWLGILSDAYVHFTPEFYNSLDWDEQMSPGGDGKIFLYFFHPSEKEIKRHFNALAAVHLTILKAFDRCFDMGISGDATKLAAVNAFKTTAKRFNDTYT
jgi:hypothetical protein